MGSKLQYFPTRKSPIRVNPRAYANLIRALFYGANSIRELAEDSGLSESSVRQYVYALQDKGMIVLGPRDRDKRGALTIRTYELVRSQNARNAQQKFSTPAERSAKYRNRKKERELWTAIHSSPSGQSSEAQSAA